MQSPILTPLRKNQFTAKDNMTSIFNKNAPSTQFGNPSLAHSIATHFPKAMRKYLRGNVLTSWGEEDKLWNYLNVDTNTNFSGANKALGHLDVTRKQHIKYYWPVVLFMSVIIGLYGGAAMFFLCLICAFLLSCCLRASAKIYIEYQPSPGMNARYTKFTKEFSALKKSKFLWVQSTSAIEGESRVSAMVGFGLPDGLTSNVKFPCLKTVKYTVYFAPDAIITQSLTKTLVNGYPLFSTETQSIAVHETNFSPSDAVSIGSRHQFVNTNGSPDKRRKHNPVLPINQYPVRIVRGAGMSFKIMVSNPKGMEGINFEALIPSVDDRNRAANVKAAAQQDLTALESKPVERGPLSDVVFNSINSSQSKVKTHKKATEINFDNELTSVDLVREVEVESFKIPKCEVSSAKITRTNWIPKNQKVVVNGIQITGGMFYFSQNGTSEFHVSLVEGNQPIGKGTGDYRHELAGYWPRYRGLRDDDRRAFLRFLASDRSDPNTGIGFVFLYFYGLERRLLVDSKDEQIDPRERAEIIDELNRLLTVFGTNRSVRSYTGALLNFLSGVESFKSEPYDDVFAKAMPKPGSGIVNTKIDQSRIQMAISQFVNQHGYLSCDWAYIWAQQYSGMLDKTVTGYKPLFYKAFCETFKARYPDGLTLQKSNTPFTLSYKPAASDLDRADIKIGELMNIANEANSMKVREVLGDVYRVTEPYWRIKRKSTSTAFTVEPFMHLPSYLWPPKLEEITEKLANKLKKASAPILLADLIQPFELTAINRQSLTRLFTRLGEQGIYVEPNTLQDAPTPKITDQIVIFNHDAGEHLKPATASFAGATVFIELACAVSVADGNVSLQERAQILSRVEHWDGLTEFERKRLQAKVTLLLGQTITFAKLKSKLKLLPQHEVEHVAQLLAHVCGSDSTISPQEVALLEKIFAALDIPNKLHEYLHHSSAVANRPSVAGKGAGVPDSRTRSGQTNDEKTQELNNKAPEQPVTAATDFNLDFAKIAALQAETRHVASILSEVFDQDQDGQINKADAAVAKPNNTASIEYGALPGLNKKQVEFLTALLTQSEWDRNDLGTEASRVGLMLDGALEVVNEACWDAFDDPLFEGDLIVEIDQSIATQIMASRRELEPV